MRCRLAVVAVAVLAVACGGEEAASAKDSGQVECPSSGAPTGTAPGQRFPDVAVTTCDGIRTDIRSTRCGNDVTVLSIGAGWCEPCKEETPQLQQLGETMADQNVGVAQILFQDAQGDPATTLFCKSWVDGFALTIPVFVDPPGGSLALFDVKLTPLNLIIRRDGTVLWSELGKVPEDLGGTVASFLPP